MTYRPRTAAALPIAAILGLFVAWACAQDPNRDPNRKPIDPNAGKPTNAPFDAVADAQTPQPAPGDRVEQRKQEQDQGAKFDGDKAPSASTAFPNQPEEGKIKGFDFYRDPLNAAKPGQTPQEIMKQDVADKPKVMDAQKKLLESRYVLEPKTDPAVKMSRGKLVPIGPTAKLAQGATFDQT